MTDLSGSGVVPNGTRVGADEGGALPHLEFWVADLAVAEREWG